MKDQPSNKFFLISFIPALAYWYLEETQTLQIAVIGGLALAVIEVILEKILTKHIHSLSLLNFVILAVLGPISLIGEDGLWFKLQPFFTGVFLFAYFTYLSRRGDSLMVNMSRDMGLKKPLPSDILIKLEKHLSYFLLCFGIFMGFLAKFSTTSTWAFFKTIGFYLTFIVFMLIEMFLLRRSLKSQAQRDQIVEMMKNIRPE